MLRSHESNVCLMFKSRLFDWYVFNRINFYSTFTYTLSAVDLQSLNCLSKISFTFLNWFCIYTFSCMYSSSSSFTSTVPVIHLQFLFYICSSSFTSVVSHPQLQFYIYSSCFTSTVPLLHLQFLFYICSSCSTSTVSVLHV